LIFKSYEGRLLRVDDLPALCEKSSVSSDKHESSGESQNQDASQLSEGSSRPGDDYNARATNEDTAQILERHGWAVTRSDSPLWKARRPNKEDEGDSATIGHYGAGQLFVFSSNAAPFKEGRNYKPFQVKAILDHHGDYKSAARDLAQRSFGNAQPSGVAPNDQNSQRHETGQTEDGSPLDASRIPAPSFRNERGALEYEPAQLVELIHPNWGCASLSSEAAHANRIRDAYGHDTRYSPNLGWVTFDGRQFQRDDRHSTQTTHKVAALSRVVREEAGQLYEFAGELARMGRGSDAEAMSRAAASHTRYAKQVEQRKYVQEALKFAAGDPQIRVSPDAFDQRPYVLGFANGVWDKGVFREHRREDMMLHLCPVTYDCKADQREWQQLLDRMSGGDDDFKRSLQDVAGYILSGASNLRFLPWLYGPKATGKSTFAELIQTVLGPMAMVIDPKKMGADSARERLGADLYNRRLAICAEAGNQKLDGELLKTLSGSDTLSVRFLYQEAFDALPRHTLLMVSNDAPNLDAYDDALKDRVLAFPFEHRLDEGGRLELTGGARIESVRKDTQSPLLRGFVAWAVEGMARVLETQTIFRAPCIEAATAQFWQDADLLTPFWENYSQAELRAGVANGALRSSYQLWCEDEGFRPLGGKNFARACKSRGLVQKFRGPANNRVRVWFLEQTPSGKASPRRSSSDCEHNAHNGAVFSKPSIAVTESHREVCKNSPDSVHSVHSVDNPVAEEPEGDGQYGGQWNYGVRKLTVQEMCDQLGI
jgi:P4 family phage/plasmid primase-like protien